MKSERGVYTHPSGVPYMISEERRKAKLRDHKKYMDTKVDQLVIRVPKGRGEYYKSVARSLGTSFNLFAISAMDDLISSRGLDINE